MEAKHFVIIYLCIESIKFIAAKVLNEKEHLEKLGEIAKNQKETAQFMQQAASTLAHIATFRCPYIDNCKSDEKDGAL